MVTRRCWFVLLCGIMLAGVLGSGSAVRAYNTFPFTLPGGATGYSKWGDNHAGTTGGVVTWSLMPTGTTINPTAYEATYMHGTSNLAPVFNQVGGQSAALALIQSALNHWSQAANIEFVYAGVDDGAPFASPYAPGQTLGNIRIGGFDIDGFSAGVGFAAPPNGGTTLEGDIILNNRSDISFYNAPGAEGALYDLYPPGGGLYRNDFEGLLAHELGHALGLAHSNVPNGLMCGYVSPDFDGSQCAYYDADGDGKAPINRIPDADDVAGIQFLYGAASSADFNGDGAVDGDDFLAWQRGVGIGSGAVRGDGDANNDHMVNGLDLGEWRGSFAAVTAAVAAVPEPRAGLLFGVAFAMSAFGRRRA